MGLLTSLGLRRTGDFDPPTALDDILDSPLQFLLTHIYTLILVLRGALPRPPRPQGTLPVRIVCLSDTHDQTVRVPPGDLLIHAGDLTNAGRAVDIQRQLDWLAAQPHLHKVLICGNHDSWFDPAARRPDDTASGATLDFKGMHYLEHSSVALRFGGNGEKGRTLRVYGAPDIPRCGGDDFA